ncbi:MAG: sugar phosphate isomerase/epimerase [Clostridia bacterium]|nr:sugar phosphate isomerase/epimerase [Clostridia bacterium]
MKLGAFTALFGDQTLDATLDYLQNVGFEAVELYTGALAPPVHCDPAILLNSDTELSKFKDSLKRHQMTLSMLNTSGNPVSPDPDLAKRHHRAFENTVRLAEKTGVAGVIVFSGCPGGSPVDRTPNWITCPWPEEYLTALEYQWNDVLIPYWRKAAQFAADHGVTRLAFEMHPGFCVYNPESLLKLRSAVGPAVGANFDPSHLFWQGIQADKAILQLNEAVFHFHAKDTRIFADNVASNGVLDPKHYSHLADRSWIFGTVGYGQPEAAWTKIINALAVIGYDYVISIEHEDALMSKKEGLEKAYHFLRRLIIAEKPGEMWWA